MAISPILKSAEPHAENYGWHQSAGSDSKETPSGRFAPAFGQMDGIGEAQSPEGSRVRSFLSVNLGVCANDLKGKLSACVLLMCFGSRGRSSKGDLG